LDSALYGYLSRCSAPFSALRAMLLTAELLRTRPGGAKDDAAKWIMRTMESNLVGEMTRALLVERTAYCFSTGEKPAASSQETSESGAPATVNYRGSRLRKAAFWSVLAAEHWSTIGKHRLARHALSEALKVYGNTKWIAIQGTLNLLKTESGLVKDYQLSPPAVTPSEQPPVSTPKAEKVKPVQQEALPIVESAFQAPGQETSDMDGDDTITLEHGAMAEPPRDISAPAHTLEDEVDDPLRID
jgi:hypothetical protein